MSDEAPRPPSLNALGAGSTIAGSRQGDATTQRQTPFTDTATAAGMPTDAAPKLLAPAALTAPGLPTLAGPAVPSLPNIPQAPSAPQLPNAAQIGDAKRPGFNLSGPTQQDSSGDFPTIPTLPGLAPSQGAPPTMPGLRIAAAMPTLTGVDVMDARKRARDAIAARNGRQSTFLTSAAGRPARATPATLASPSPATTRRTYG